MLVKQVEMVERSKNGHHSSPAAKGEHLYQTKREFYNNLNIKSVTGNKPFWKTVKYSLQISTSEDTKLVEVLNILEILYKV